MTRSSQTLAWTLGSVIALGLSLSCHATPRTNSVTQRTNSVVGLWWPAVTDDDCWGYILHATNNAGWSNAWQFVGNLNTNVAVSVPAPAVTHFWLGSYNYGGESTNFTNVAFVPGWPVVDIAGTELVCFSDLRHPIKHFVESPWSATNAPGISNPACLFFESADSSGPTYRRRMFHGY